VQKAKFADASAVDGTDAAEIENHFAAILKDFTDQARKGSNLVAIDDAAVAVNDHHIAAISSFQTELQLRLLKCCSEAAQFVRRGHVCQFSLRIAC
jgi:hypothetical protein